MIWLCAHSAQSATVTLYWTGTISYVAEFSDNAVPAGISEGAVISGELRFEAEQYSNHGNILGSHSFGDRYGYGNVLVLTARAAGHEWGVTGSDVSLMQYADPPTQSFDVFSTSDRNSFDPFPKSVGYSEFGFALLNQGSAYSIFDNREIQRTVFDFEHPTSASGFLSSRLFEPGGNISDGYYLQFTISRTSSIPIPESSVGMLWCGMVFLLSGKGGILARGKAPCEAK